jgi:aminopeptidase N
LPPPQLPPDPAARLRSVAADVSSALQFYSGLFAGPPSLKSLTVSPIPGNFGQGFPGLIYLSTLAYLSPSERPPGLQGQIAQVFYSDLIEAHEVAHQWWGGLVLPDGYQDEWMAESLASYSALLYLEKKKGAKAMEDVLQDYRDHLAAKSPGGHTLESAGPVTWGYRLESSSEPDAWRAITYDKGAWIFHMLRRRMGDESFFKMLAELRRRYESRPVSTADLRALAKEMAPPGLKPASIDTFFDNWVYATGIPTLKLTYSIKGTAPRLRIIGEVEQTGVDDDFSIEAPVEIQFAKGPPQTIWVTTSTGSASFSAALKQVPAHVSIPAGTSILAVK